jgi:hypothetical protein
MKRLILFFIGLAAAAQAQQPKPCLKLSQVKVDHQYLRQGSATDVKLKFETKDCYVLTETQDLGRQMPTLEVQSQPGIDASVRMVGAMGLDQSTISDQLLKAREILSTVSVTASPDVSLGQHALTGTVRYKVMDEQGNVSDEVASFDVPVWVDTPAHAPVSPAAGKSFDEQHPVLSKSLIPLEVLAVIALFPLVLVAYIAGNWDGC